jgi:hypothetical protein
MKKYLSIVMFLGMSVSAFANVNTKAVQEASKEYRAIGGTLMPELKSGKISLADAESKVEKMSAHAQVVMKEYAVKYPESKKLVDFLIAKIPELKKMSFEQLEKDYHDAAALTKDKVGLDLKDESNEKFLDPCHILVHVQMVAAAVRENKHKDGVAELNEGMEQMVLAEKELSK